ncbi:50S ribosomal protein L18 [bacterium]|nr:50S ribosomal protein L18 [bacterium]
MSLLDTNKKRVNRRKFRVRNKVRRVSFDRMRLCVCRSLKHISIQLIDDSKHMTVASASSVGMEMPEKVSGKIELAKLVGKDLAKKASELSVGPVFFDRGKYKYHGRVRALAEGLREGGLEF